MSKVAFVFPGQGSQSKGMMDAYAKQFPVVKELFAQASDILNYNLWDVVSEDVHDQLNQTQFTQPALLVSSVAMWTIWQELSGGTPAVMAGHSLGEYSALVCAGAMSLEDGVALVSARGHAMQSAVASGVGAMAAIVGLTNEQVAAICEQACQIGLVSPANFNSIGQVVVSGEKAAVEKAIILANEAGAKIAKLLPVSVPSHCDLMKPVTFSLTDKLSEIEIKIPVIPVINNVDAETSDQVTIITDALVRQLCAPVRWVDTIVKIASMDVTNVVECGPGKVLSGLIKRIDKRIVTHSLAKPEALLELIASGETNVI